MKSIAHQFIRYGIVAVIAQLFDITIFYSLTTFLGAYYLFAGVMGFSIALSLNYWLSKRWVFASQITVSRQRLGVFLAVAVLGLVMTIFLLWFFTEILGIYYLYSKIVAIVIVFWWNFFARKYFVFNYALNNMKEIA